jgi:hypothetical protein
MTGGDQLFFRAEGKESVERERQREREREREREKYRRKRET